MKKLRFAALITSVCMSAAVIASMAGGTTHLGTNIKIKPFLQINFKKSSGDDQSNVGYTPTQIKKAYGINDISGTGKGQTIALVVAFDDPNIVSDLNTFSTAFNLPKAKITVDNLGNGTQNNSDPDVQGWAGETSLDVEWSHAIAPDANLILVEAASDNSDDLMSAVDKAVSSGAQIVSMSWGSSEDRTDTSYDFHFSSSSTIFLASSGDDGAGAEWPSTSPDVIAVGGTTLPLDASGNRIISQPETAWEDSGGGVSHYEPETGWQTTMGIQTRNNKRAVPDVSFDADPATGVSTYCSIPQQDNYSGGVESGWFAVGGTSLSSPSWAGLIADLNQNSVVIKNAGSFYTLAGGSSYTNQSQAFNDITSGSSGYGYNATVGYDDVTGLGSPVANKIAGQTVSSSLQSIAKRSQQLIKTLLPKIR